MYISSSRAGRISVSAVAGSVVFGLWILLVAGLCALRVPSLLRQNANHRELLGLLRRSRPLGIAGPDANASFAARPQGERALLLALSPDGNSWRLARCVDGELRVERYRDRRLVTSRTATGGESGVVRAFRTGRRVDFHTGRGRVSVDVPEGWRWWAVRRTDEGRRMPWRVVRFRSIRRTDGFQRRTFGHGDGWTEARGRWLIHTSGGGEGKSANAFMLEAGAEREKCVAHTGWKVCANYEAAVNARPASEGASYGVEAGNADAARVAFGWDGQERRWELRFRSAAGREEVLFTHDLAPPPGNWARVGLRLESPFRVVPLLDGVPLGRIELPEPVYGRAGLLADGGTVYFDDFRMDDGSSIEREGTPLFVESRSFGEKPIKDKKDDDFVKWAHDTLCHDLVGVKFGNHWYPSLRYRVPLFGDFSYRAEPGEASRIFLRLENEGKWERQFDFRWAGDGWTCETPDSASPSAPSAKAGPLELSYRDGVLYQEGAGRHRIASFRPEMPMRITICTPGRKVQPENHRVLSRTLWDEFFQQAPVGWAWWAGDFGMQYRWACQPYWNFMGGWSRRYAAGFSRAAYRGDQTIEFYISLKDLIKGQQRHRYMRQDLNFSFCTDGKSPSSGYSLLFGGFGTGATYLMKGTKVLASTEEFTLPRFDRNHHDVHWRWWHFRIEKRGGRIRVFGDEKEIFDVRDEDPPAGGHLAFWSVEDGFMLARIRVAAEGREQRPERFWCEPSRSSDTWERLNPAGTRLRTDGEWTKVTNRAGGGTVAVRWKGEPVDLESSPVLRLPFQAEEGSRVNLHLQVAGRAYILPLTAPTARTGQVLAPLWEGMEDKDFFWRLYNHRQLEKWHFLPPARPRGNVLEVNLLEALGERAKNGAVLRSLTIGNTSNEGYLLAGFGGNGPGTAYRVGTPQWHSATVAAQ